LLGLDIPFKVLEDMLLESRPEALKEPELLSLFKDIPTRAKKVLSISHL